MVRTDRIKERLKKTDKSQAWLARKMYLDPRTLGVKLKQGKFNSDELEMIAEILELENPWEFLFGRD